MDFSILNQLNQLKSKKFWWLDVILYFVISLLIATIFCYIIFSIKSSLQQEEIKKVTANLEKVGTVEQKEQEKEVLSYRKKIADFNTIFKSHQFASNIFAFMQAQTMPYIWFEQFALEQKTGSVQLSGEADNMDELSRQVQNLEKNEYVVKLSGLNSTISPNSKVKFNFSLLLDQKIFNYISDTSSDVDILETVTPSDNGI